MSVAYFDNAASTKVDPRVLEAMLPFFCDVYANPSALHSFAQSAKAAVEKAREQVAELVGANDPSEIIFTGCATEANNTVLGSFGGRLLASAIEHPSVRVVAEETGRADFAPVDEQGTVDVDAYAELLKKAPELVSIMSVNNEIGSMQDLDLLGGMAHDTGAKFHSDITQGVGKTRLDLASRPIDYATFSGHKFHAPKGVGIIWAKQGEPIHAFMVGGSHEGYRRAGTHNVPLIVGLGEAARLAMEEGFADADRMRRQREYIVTRVLSEVPDVKVNGQPNGAPHVISFSFLRTEGEAILINLDARGICCTAGSACSSGKHRASPVLEAIGLPEEWMRGTVRVSLSKFNTDEDCDMLVGALIQSVSAVRNLSGYASV
ncbi:MAG TPA: cysteine desulfurase family protein [Fimbriimonadales bacterium]|jgi:cysteine desulfurase|nr:cysteine desulfurase family protein [Fimbriimonadales bacterium]